MATVHRFEDLKVWQKARAFAKEVFILTKKEPFSKDFKHRDQINDSAGSIMDNIAEGFERSGRKEFRQFLSISKGSTAEAQSQLYRAFDKDYITESELNEKLTQTNEISRMIRGLMNYVSNSDYSGDKFKEPEPTYFTKQQLETRDDKL
ncbi:MAG: four helix bundle protein [Bacteroidetes bacterium]|nr:four helix bundle protein [Bacteroidota bacterium]